METFYTRTGRLFVPGSVAQSPWNPSHQSGIALAGLLATLVEEAPSDRPTLTTRLSVDIIRPAPMTGVEGDWRLTHEGRRVQHVEAALSADGVVVARASAVRVRLADSPPWPVQPLPFPQPEEASDRPVIRSQRNGLETRMIRGGPTFRGPGTLWARPALQLTPGAPVSFTAGAAMVADLGSACSPEIDGREWTFANVCVALHLFRAPQSDWILVDARSRTAGNGLGLVETVLADRLGPIGRAYQSLFIAARPARIGAGT